MMKLRARKQLFYKKEKQIYLFLQVFFVTITLCCFSLAAKALVNNLGVIMLQEMISAPDVVEQLDMSSIANGQYFLKVATPDAKPRVRKLVVLRTY